MYITNFILKYIGALGGPICRFISFDNCRILLDELLNNVEWHYEILDKK